MSCLGDNNYESNLGLIYFHDVEHWNIGTLEHWKSHLFVLNPHSEIINVKNLQAQEFLCDKILF